jgi:mono/diheme cytochrome c family protein
VKHTITLLTALLLALPTALFADDSPKDEAAALIRARTEAAKTFKNEVSPFMETYCLRCHTDNRRSGGVTFQDLLKNPNGPAFQMLWKRASTQIAAHDMPPANENRQPSEKERRAVIEWVAGMKKRVPKDPGLFVIRRLNKREYGNTLHDIFGVDPAIARELPDEVVGAGYTNTLSPLLIEKYLSIANNVLDKSFSPPGSKPTAVQRRLLGESPDKGVDPTVAARKVARSLARLAFRRPASDAEVDVLMRVFSLARQNGKPYPEALRLMVKATLVSPQFLFITPVKANSSGNKTVSQEMVPLDDYQLASRLSYLLWATMPDSELSALADSGKLQNTGVLAAQARRLLKDPRSRALFDGFGAQWLGLDKLEGKMFDTEKFPQMTGKMRLAMYDEARLFFQEVLRNNLKLTTLIDSNSTYLNESLATIYGMEGTVRGEQMRRVILTNSNRGGILTMPGILANSSFPNRTSPVNRGVWVLEQVLGEHVPPPPPNVPPLEKQDKLVIANMTLRQRTELHRSNAVCASCHKVLDPIGFGLENFDAIGRWRTVDDSAGKIDASGELPGGLHFSTPAELKRIIADRKDDFCRSLTSKLLAYALGRQLEGYDEIVVDEMTDSTKNDDYRMQTLVVGVVTSYPFTHRRETNSGETQNAK